MACNCENQNSEDRKSEDQNREAANQDNQPKKDAVSRRNFFARIVYAVGAFIGIGLITPLITAMLDPVTRKKKKIWRPVGTLDSFKKGQTRMVTFENASPYKWGEKIANSAAYVRRQQDDTFIAFSVNCAHLGCPVRWVQKSELFLCPCHGGVYYKDGSRAAGPPPRGLFKYPIRVVGNSVEIETEAIPLTNMTA